VTNNLNVQTDTLVFFLPATGVVSNHGLLMSVNFDFINNGI